MLRISTSINHALEGFVFVALFLQLRTVAKRMKLTIKKIMVKRHSFAPFAMRRYFRLSPNPIRCAQCAIFLFDPISLYLTKRILLNSLLLVYQFIKYPYT